MATRAEEAIRAEIARRGPIPFADFMALALGHPDGGYYAGPEARPTRGGDFLTAPELHPIFGATLARQVAEAWERLGRPEPFTLLEYGAGAGTLALAILAGLRDDGSPLAGALAYAPVELNPHRLAELRTRAVATGLRLVDPAALDDAPAAGLVVANEFLDALPVHVVEIGEGRSREIHVGLGCDGAFEEIPGELSGPAVAEHLAAIERAGIVLAEGQRLEVRPAVGLWAAEVGRRLAAGVVLVIDYGAMSPTAGPTPPSTTSASATSRPTSTPARSRPPSRGPASTSSARRRRRSSSSGAGWRSSSGGPRSRPRPSPRPSSSAPPWCGCWTRATWAASGRYWRDAASRAGRRCAGSPTGSRPCAEPGARRGVRHAARLAGAVPRPIVPCYDAPACPGHWARACARLTRASRRAGGHAAALRDPAMEPAARGRREVRWKASGTWSGSPSRASPSSS